MPENQTYHFTMGSDLDPHVVANKAASIEKKGEVTAKQNMDGLRIKPLHESKQKSAVYAAKGGHNKRCPWRACKIEYLLC